MTISDWDPSNTLASAATVALLPCTSFYELGDPAISTVPDQHTPTTPSTQQPGSTHTQKVQHAQQCAPCWRLHSAHVLLPSLTTVHNSFTPTNFTQADTGTAGGGSCWKQPPGIFPGGLWAPGGLHRQMAPMAHDNIHTHNETTSLRYNPRKHTHTHTRRTRTPDAHTHAHTSQPAWPWPTHLTEPG